jgi:hypothetical protein
LEEEEEEAEGEEEEGWFFTVKIQENQKSKRRNLRQNETHYEIIEY